MTALLPGIFLFWFGTAYEPQMVSYGLKIVFKDALHAQSLTSVQLFQVWHIQSGHTQTTERVESRYLLDLLNVIVPVLEVSSCDYSNHLNINSAWNWQLAVCVCVAEARTHAFNTFFSSAKVFISSVKRICLQCKRTILLLAIIAFVFYLEVGFETPKKNRNQGEVSEKILHFKLGLHRPVKRTETRQG